MSRATSTIINPVKSTASIVELAQQIQSDTRLISSYVAENSLPELSLSADAYPFFPSTGPPMLRNTSAHRSRSSKPEYRLAMPARSYVIDDTFPAASKLADAVEKYPRSQETNETAWNLAHGTDLSVFQYFEKHPSRMKRFMGAMNMMISFNSGERDLDGWKSLFKMPDSWLGLRYIVTPPGSALSIMELDLRGPDSIRSPTR
ncbi:hypothetical protein LTR46_008980 [Exophiala xenobiotica]|nr:hypothetical protein LTR46_008980 [Exophiala xenobiotica]